MKKVLYILGACCVLSSFQGKRERAGTEVIKLFLLNSAEHEIFHAHKC